MSDQATSVDFPQPSIGRIVHFHTPSSDEPRAALVLGNIDPSGRYGTCALKVFNIVGNDVVVDNVIYDTKRADDAANWWTWPPRV